MKHWADGDSSPWRPPLTREEAQLLEQAYAEAIQLGFLGPRERERLWERHLDDAFGLAAIRTPAPGERWADLGSGAGLPGLPLAVAHRATSFTMIDAQRRRLDWVEAAAQRPPPHQRHRGPRATRGLCPGPGASVVRCRDGEGARATPGRRRTRTSPAHDRRAAPRSARAARFRGARAGSGSPASCSVVGSTRLSPTRARRLTGSVSSLSWQRSLRPPPASPGDRACRRELRSVSSARTSAS